MTAAVHEIPKQNTSPRPRHDGASVQRIVIATINRAEGDTGVHTHTRMLHHGLVEAGVACDVIGPFDGSPKWLPVFAIRPLLLRRINKTWSTLWHRKWHMAAVRENLLRHLRSHPADVVLAQCPVSARAALRAPLGQPAPSPGDVPRSRTHRL